MKNLVMIADLVARIWIGYLSNTKQW